MPAQVDHPYTVRGSWPFPLDMLRRDNAVAATTQDRELIERYSGEVSPPEGLAPVEINLVIPEAGSARPNTERWVSLSWEVTTDYDYHLTQGIVAKEAAMSVIANRVLSGLTEEEREAVTWHVLRKRRVDELLS